LAPNVTVHFFPDNDINGTPLLEITDEDEYFQGLKLNPDLWSLGGWELTLARNINFALFSSGAVQPEVFVRFLVHAWSDTKYFYGGVLQKRQQDVIDRDEAGAETFVFGGPGPKQYMDRYRLGTIQLTGSGWNLDLENGVWRFNETATSGRVLNRLVAEDAAAANPALPDLTSTFDQTDDSNGNPWTDTIADADGSFELPIGNSLLQTIWDLEDLADLYTTVELGTVSAPLYELNAYETFGDDNSGTSFGPSVCLLREGDNIANDSLTVTGVAMKKPTHVIIEGKDGAWATKRRPSWSSGDYIKWEKIEYPRSNSQVILEKAGLRWLQRQTNAFDQITVEIVPGAAPSDGFYFPKPDGLLWVGNTITLDTVADGSTHSPLDYNNSPQLVTGLEIVLGPAGDDTTADKEAKSWDVKVKLNGERGGNSSHPDQRSASTGGGSCKCIKLCRSAFTTAEAGAYVTTHTGTAGTGGSINVPWPATDNNDLALLYFYAEDDRIVSTPSGWTLIDRIYSATADATTALFAKICDGTESGNQLVNGTGWGIGQSKAGKIFIFEGVDISGISVPVYTEGNGTTVTAPTVDGNDLLAIAFTGVTESQTQVAFTGETGGDWVEINDDNFVNSAVETCSATITGSSISGGSKTLSTTSEWIVTGITLGVSDAVNGQADLVGTSGDASRCDHAHHVLRLDDPIATDDEESGYPPTTLWTVVDDLDNPTEVISTWLSIDGSDDAAVWVSFGNSGTMEHGDLTGLTDDDHPQYLRTTLGGRDVVNTVAAAGSTETLSLVTANVHDVTLSADCTLTLSGATNGVACTMNVLLRQGSGAPWLVTWPGSVAWVGGSAPTLETAVNAWNWVTLITLDGGTVWFGEAVTASGGGGGAPTTADYLVGTAQGGLSAEIVVGTTPNGELGGTWGAITVDATHSGSAHHTESHQSRHNNAGADALKLDDLAAPDDNTDLNASTSAHGLLKKLPGGTTTFLRADGSFANPGGGTGGASIGEGRPFLSGQPTMYVLPGQFFTPSITAGQNTTGNRYYTAIIVREQITLVALMAECTLGAAAGRAYRGGLYEADWTWQPGALVLEGAFDCSTTGVKTIAAAGGGQVLVPGRYLTVHETNHNTPTMRVWQATAMFASTGSANAISSQFVLTGTTYGALPDPGTAWTAILQSNTGSQNRVLLQVDP
jgi:hypothetical protein